MEKYAVIVAAGSGTRMGSTIPKQFLDLVGKPLLWYTLSAFIQAYDDMQIVLVVSNEHRQQATEIISMTAAPEKVTLAGGGSSRYHSVKNGLALITAPSIIFVHDAVRCLVSKELIHECFEVARKTGNAVPAIPSVDSVRLETAEGNYAVERKNIKLVQTPQTFTSDIIKRAFEQEFDPAFTDEASMVERLGIKINLVSGEATNIKITTPIDLLLANKILQEKNPIAR